MTPAELAQTGSDGDCSAGLPALETSEARKRSHALEWGRSGDGSWSRLPVPVSMWQGFKDAGGLACGCWHGHHDR